MPESISQQSLQFIYTWGGKDLVKLVSFRNILKLLDCLLPEFYGASLWDAMFHLS